MSEAAPVANNIPEFTVSEISGAVKMHAPGSTPDDTNPTLPRGRE